jgi:cation diffusion facilitator family transporter
MPPRSLAARTSSRTVVYAALAGNLLVAATKFFAAAVTGSAAMLSEAVHSSVDSGNELLLLYGMRRAQVRPDDEHPLGHGRELYFWSFVVALLVFALGAGVSLVEGLRHVLHPRPIENPLVSYLILGISALFDGATWWIALGKFKGKKSLAALLGAVRDSKDPPSFMVLFEDSAALIGILVAFLGTFLSVQLKLPVLDGVASMVIGLVLAATATLLVRETKGLLIGERADPSIVDSITRIAEEMDGVAHAHAILTVHLAPRQIVVALSLEFDDELRTPQIEAKVLEIEQRICGLRLGVVAIFVKPQSAAGFKASVERQAAPLDTP